MPGTECVVEERQTQRIKHFFFDLLGLDEIFCIYVDKMEQDIIDKCYTHQNIYG